MVYGVQALSRSHANPFYKQLHVTLAQFSYITDLFLVHLF
jgi:hypothetical protein